MNQSAPRGVTDLLADWTDGNKAALDRLMPIVYDAGRTARTSSASRRS